MEKFFILIVSSVAGSLGWWAGSFFFGMTAAFLISTVASFVGLYYGWKWSCEMFG